MRGKFLILFSFFFVFVLLAIVSIAVFSFGVYLISSAKNIPVLVVCTFVIFILSLLGSKIKFVFLKRSSSLAFITVLVISVIIALGNSIWLEKKAMDDIKTKSKQLLDLFSVFHKGTPIIDARRIDNSNNLPAMPQTGQLWSPDNDESIFWFNGLTWNLIKDDMKKYIGTITIKLQFNPVPKQAEPIISTGVSGAGDSLYIKYLSSNKATIGFDHWGVSGFSSNPFKINPNHIYEMEVGFGSFYPGADLGELTRNVIVKIDENLVLNTPSGFHPTTLGQIVLGKNVVACSVCGREFTGHIFKASCLDKEFK